MTVALGPAVAVRVLMQRGREHGWDSLNRTQIVKLLYFVDLAAVDEVGYPFTTLDWVWDQYGPFSAEIYRALEELAAQQVIAELPPDPTATNVEHRYVFAGDAAADVEPDVARVVDRVLVDHHGQSASTLREAAYNTPPMLRVQLHGERGDELDLFADTGTEREAMRYLSATHTPDDFRTAEALAVIGSRRDAGA